MTEALPRLTAEWLTTVLQTSDAMESGEVEAVREEPSMARGVMSDVARLQITYSSGATGSLPRWLFIKSTRPDTHSEFARAGEHEVEFYRAAIELGDLPVPRCYFAASSPEGRDSLLITDDLTETHFTRPLPIPPSNDHCVQLIDALASLHGRFWGDRRLGSSLGSRMTPERARLQTDRLLATMPDFFDFLGDALLPWQRRIYDQIAQSPFLADAYQRLIDLDRVTLIHGDVHSGNVMLPRGSDGNIKLIDWQLWDIGVAAYDLAFLVALHWPPSRRQVLEQPLLQRYHLRLIETGVQNYSWTDFFDDYRRAVITMVLIPIGQFRRGMPNGVIWHGLQDAMDAFQDLHCEEVLEA